MRKLSTLGVAAAFALAATGTAIAAAPHSGKYKGTTSAPAFNKFKDPVTFNVLPANNTITDFAFGTFGCLGMGGHFTPGTNYWLTWLKTVNRMHFKANGAFSGAGKWSQHAPKLTDTFTYTVSGRFSKNGKSASGTIKVTQRTTGAEHLKCNQTPMTFHAHL